VSGFTFRLRSPPTQRVDLARLTPQALRGRSIAEIGALRIHTTRALLTVGDLFDLREGDLEEIVFEGGAERLDRVGAGLSAGRVRVVGDVGVEAGRGMTGGVLTIEGGAGPYAGSGMRGGLLKIRADAGERLGGPLAGETEGMNGGAIHVGGSAGARAGDKLRRGFILVEGEAGDYAGSRMIAGTLAIGGRAGALPGYLMNRGTILLAEGATEMAPTFLDCGAFELVAAKLLAAHVETMSARLGAAFRGPLRRYAGDLAALGKGEIFLKAT
jgi:formylmethanofuran dehydrogenase subunit C